MEIDLYKRKLNNKEISELIVEIRKFPNPLTSKKTWESLSEVYILKEKSNLIGVCGVTKLNNWIKLGPFVVFEKYHGKGYGTKIIKSIINDYSNSNLFVGSRNPAVAKIALSFNFHEITNIFKLPKVIFVYLIKNMFKSFNYDYFKELIKKRSTKEGPFRFFLKNKV